MLCDPPTESTWWKKSCQTNKLWHVGDLLSLTNDTNMNSLYNHNCGCCFFRLISLGWLKWNCNPNPCLHGYSPRFTLGTFVRRLWVSGRTDEISLEETPDNLNNNEPEMTQTFHSGDTMTQDSAWRMTECVTLIERNVTLSFQRGCSHVYMMY